MAVYDMLAGYYDAVAGDPTEARFVDRMLRSAARKPATLLEAACGTGAVMAALAGRYQVSGLDISPGMLAVARGKLPTGTPLHLADMSRFQLQASFDAVICVYHGVNHLLGFSSWEGFFDCAHRHLNDGGMLVFDLMTVGTLARMARRRPTTQRFGKNSLRIAVRSLGGATFGWDIELAEARPGGGRTVHTGTIATASFPPARIRHALRERFTSVESFETGGGPYDGEGRLWFACAKR